MGTSSFKFAAVWCAILLVAALARVHFRVVTTTVAYNLGQLKEREATLLEQRATLQADLAKLTGRRQLESLSGNEERSH